MTSDFFRDDYLSWLRRKAGPRILANVYLEGIEIDVEIGVALIEEEKVQRLTIDVVVEFDDRRTRIHDSKLGLSQGFDYSTVRQCVIEAASTRVHLLETIANRIADSVLALPHVQIVTVCFARAERQAI